MVRVKIIQVRVMVRVKIIQVRVRARFVFDT